MLLTEKEKSILATLRGRDFLGLHDYGPEEISCLLALARLLKSKRSVPILDGKALAMIFMKASTRTRVSFEVGIRRLGGTALILSGTETHLGRGEPISDTARVLERYVDGIIVRTYAHSDIVEFAHFSSVPVINALTDDLHPCQALADLLTIQEHKGRLAGIRLVYIGDGNNMAHSLLFAGAKTGIHVTICCPEGYAPNPVYLAQARVDAVPGTRLEVVHGDPLAAARDADVLYTDAWASMGQEAEQAVRAAAFREYQIDGRVLAAAHPNCIVLHCLPAHREEEITAEVLEGPQSVVFDQAENRLHVQNAIMATLMGNPAAFL